MNRRGSLGVAVAIGLLAASMAATGSAHAKANQNGAFSNSLSTRALTTDGADTYSIRLSKGVITATAPSTNTGGNRREVFWPSGQPSSLDGTVCATWADQSHDRIQEGIALRIVSGRTSTRALTVTKNVWADVFWVFNIHMWDSSQDPAFTAIASFDMGPVVLSTAGYQPFPWRVCARVAGSTFTFKVWLPDREPEPDWSDPVHAGSATVPPGYVTSGKMGWYVGHIPPGGVAHYNQLGIIQ